MYADSVVMAWMIDEFTEITKRHEPGTITGKREGLGGSKVRNRATALGGTFVLETLGEKIGLAPRNCRIAIQGFGNVGAEFARLASETRFQIAAISHTSATIHAKDGLDIEALSNHKREAGSLASVALSAKMQRADPREILTLDCDLFVPAAMANQITEINACQIEAKAILELANGPVSSNADDILIDRGIVVVPDSLANAGGVAVSYMEWIQNRMGDQWTEEEVSNRLRDRMIAQTRKVVGIAESCEIDLRCAAYVPALQRLASAAEARGTSDLFAGGS